ncbi:hypothetical protein [Pseudoxanthomonas sp. UTMC 1351]|uniref:hypothetical protein n=1 Tax=Pseudoxanthomonas sp. UTMC 1351 TaxID=2695853 RepID=UPI0034CF077F
MPAQYSWKDGPQREEIGYGVGLKAVLSVPATGSNANARKFVVRLVVDKGKQERK